MKPIKAIIYISCTGLLALGCKKEVVTYLETHSNSGTANLKVIYASPYTTNTPVQLKINDTRVSNNISNATPFPGGGLNTGGDNRPWYMSLAPGAAKISVSIPRSGSDADSVALYSNTVNIEADKYYSAYLTDTAGNTQTVFITENTAPAPAGQSRFKFVNLMPNVTALDLYFGATKVASNVPYKGVSAEFNLNRGDTAHWYIRSANALPTTGAVAVYPALNASPFAVPNQRILSVFSRGYSGSTGNRAPNVSLLYN